MKRRHETSLPRFLIALVMLAATAKTMAGDVGFELQVYPTGIIPGVRFETEINERGVFHLRLGAQTIRHQDFGVHDDERGDGVGISLGYKRYLKRGYKGAAWGLRSDLWFNTLDWTDNPGTAMELSGTTDVLVLQPTVELSWLHMATSNLFITPSVAAGFEINVMTEGEEVGQGFIFIIGLTIGTRL